MKVFILFGQRRVAYDGEFAPEALAVISEYGNDDNPEYMESELAEARASGDFSAVRVFSIEVDDDAIDAALKDFVKVPCGPIQLED